GDPDRPFRRFFFPGSRPGTRGGEEAYLRTARAVRSETSRRPTSRRIFRVDCSVDGQPCRLQVGEPTPDGGDIISAIFELRDPGGGQGEAAAPARGSDAEARGARGAGGGRPRGGGAGGGGPAPPRPTGARRGPRPRAPAGRASRRPAHAREARSVGLRVVW